MRVEGREQRLGVIGRSIGVVAFVLAVPFSCTITMLFVKGLDIHNGLAVLVLVLAPLALPIGVSMFAVKLMRRKTANMAPTPEAAPPRSDPG